MSFSWPATSIPTFAGIKPATTNSFADALKRLAEHVEEKNKNTTNSGGASDLIQSSTHFSNRIIPSHVNNSVPPQQTLRLYTQYIHEAERREDMRRCYLRAFGGSDVPNANLPTLNRRLDVIDSYRFMAPHLSSLLHPTAYLHSFTQQTRIPLPPSPLLFPNIKTTDTTPPIPTQENTTKKSEQLTQLSKTKIKLFRPYDLDNSNSNSHQASSAATKKSIPSPSTFSDESQTTTSSGKEKQLFNSLGLVQQSIDIIPEKSSSMETSPSITINDNSTSIETVLTQQDNYSDNSPINIKDSSLSTTLKRKSIASSNRKKSPNRKQSKLDTIHNTVK